MKVENLKLSGLKLVRPEVVRDNRGFFLESYSYEKYVTNGITCKFVQDNFSYSVQGTLRGMHIQLDPKQDKLVSVVDGSIYDVAVDSRPGSETFGKWVAVILTSTDYTQLFIPAGFAHGFCVTSSSARVHYKCSAPYNKATETGFRWDDKDISIVWPINNPILSDRDQDSLSFSALKRLLSLG